MNIVAGLTCLDFHVSTSLSLPGNHRLDFEVSTPLSLPQIILNKDIDWGLIWTAVVGQMYLAVMAQVS